MFLLNERMIQEGRGPHKSIEIAPFDPGSVGPTWYRFGLGRKYQRWNKDKSKWEFGELEPGADTLDIMPDEFLLVASRERFRCSEQTMAIFGQSSRLFRLGLSLRHSPFIDPNFPHEQDAGYLELGLKNELPRTVHLKLGEHIGKVCFFNISDTYPIIGVQNKATADDYARRRSQAGPQPVMSGPDASAAYLHPDRD